jgi:hypothetical protein
MRVRVAQGKKGILDSLVGLPALGFSGCSAVPVSGGGVVGVAEREHFTLGDVFCVLLGPGFGCWGWMVWLVWGLDLGCWVGTASGRFFVWIVRMRCAICGYISGCLLFPLPFA